MKDRESGDAAQTLERIAVVGLGLIGGSIAKALRNADRYVLGIDDARVGLLPGVSAAVSDFAPLHEINRYEPLVRKSDLIVLCQPVGVIESTISEYLGFGTVVTDTGSTKRRIVGRAENGGGGCRYVPGHPMAGKARGGFENAAADLFSGRPWILCSRGKPYEAVGTVEALLKLVGAVPVVMTPEEHDRAVAICSHVPQILSSWLYLAAKKREALAASGPTFTEMTRTAGGPEAIWQDIFETNADEIGLALQEAAATFAALSDAFLTKPPRIGRVLDVLERARTARAPSR